MLGVGGSMAKGMFCRIVAVAGVSAIAGLGTLGGAGDAEAGGFAIREQSASSQGASFAGSAAGHDLSSMYWNPAAVGVKGPGLHSESHYSLIVPRADVTVETYGGAPVGLTGLASESGNIGKLAIVGASYGSYQLSEKLFVGFGMNSPFGLVTEPENQTYAGAELGRTTKLLTLNANPIVGYKVTRGVTVAVGFQAQYADGRLKFATGFPGGPTTGFEGDDWAFGGTAGILLQPSSGTSIGLGYRSRLTHTLEGDLFTKGSFLTRGAELKSKAEAEINLPDIVTLSMSQALSSNMRIMGTVEWSNWSRFEELTVVSQEATGTIFGPVAAGQNVATIDAGWDDGWFFSLGGEYDVMPNVTMRAGVAYEISPVQEAEQRVLGIPDSDRVWLSLGATTQITQSTTIDLAYTHIFLKDGDFNRTTLGAGTPITGNVEASTDIVSVSMKTKW